MAVDPSAQSQELSPDAADPGGLQPGCQRPQQVLGLVLPAGDEERLDGDEIRLRRIAGRNVLGPGNFVGDLQRGGGIATPERDSRLEDTDGPLIPAAGLRAVLAVGFARALQAATGFLVVASNQVNLRKGVEDRARRLAHELHRAAHVQRPVEGLLGARQVPEPHADLAERRQRDAQPVRRAGLLLQLDAALGERHRLIVAVLHHRHVRLVAADDGDARRRRGPSGRDARHAAAPPSLRRGDRPGRGSPPTANGRVARCLRSPAA